MDQPESDFLQVILEPAHAQDTCPRMDRQLRNHAANPAISEGVPRSTGIALSGVVALGTAGMDRVRMGHFGDNRHARYYYLTRSGRKQLADEAGNWKRLSTAIE